MKLLTLLFAAVYSELLNCDIATLYSTTCDVENGFKLSIAGGLSTDCTELVADGTYKTVGVAENAAAPSNQGTCWDAGAMIDVQPSSVLDIFGTSACSTTTTQSPNILVKADIYVLDSNGNRPFDKLTVQCTLPETVSITQMTFGVTETASTGPQVTGTRATGTVKAYDIANDVTDAVGPFAIQANIYFYVDIVMHSRLQFQTSSCSIDGTEITSSYAYIASCTNANAQINPTGQSFGECIMITGNPSNSRTVTCTATLGLTP